MAEGGAAAPDPATERDQRCAGIFHHMLYAIGIS